MSDANRMRMASVWETTPGTTPATPRMRTARLTGESLKWAPVYEKNPEMRADRMNSDPSKKSEQHAGQVRYALSYPVPDSHLSDVFRSNFMSDWINTPSRFNDGTADSVITDVDAGTQVVSVDAAGGDPFVASHLVAFSGFTAAANGNGAANAPVLRKCTTGSDTAPAFASSGLVDEAAPPAAARMKVVGCEGASGDLVAVSDGITSSALNFTTLGIAVGMWIKPGGTGAGFRFATEANNDWARVVGVAANKLTLDNLPVGWGADAGTGKTLRIFFGDYIRNGLTLGAMSIERAFLDHSPVSYQLHKGLRASQLAWASEDQAEVIALTVDYLGLGFDKDNTGTPFGNTYDAETTNRVMTPNGSVTRISEGGVKNVGPSWIKSFTVTMGNGARQITTQGYAYPVAHASGANDVSVSAPSYYGDTTYLDKLADGVASNLGSIQEADNQAVILTIPRVTWGDGSANAEGRDTDVMLPLTGIVSKDTLTGCEKQLDRVEYFQA